jgi:uncharacterized repeat protein (TIGR02543 family)/LPXTG-motif cell wall-anchored protein
MQRLRGWLTLFLSLALWASLSTTLYAYSPPSYSGGDGSIDNPFVISSKTELLSFMNDVSNPGRSAHYRLAANIDLSGESWIPIGDMTIPFSGTFNGDEYTISNLTIAHTTTEDVEYIGMFGVCKDCKIRDVYLSDVTINVLSDDASVMVGALVGIVVGDTNALIYDIRASGTIMVNYQYEGTDTNYDAVNVGGVVGRFLSSSPDGAYDKIMRVQSSVDVSVGVIFLAATTNYMTFSIGGLVGYAEDVGLHDNEVNGSTIEFLVDPLNNSYDNFLSGSRIDVGGLVGWADHYNVDYGYDGPAILYRNQVGNTEPVIVKGFFNVGGLAGAVTSINNTKVTENNVKNTLVSGERDVGGLVGDSTKVSFYDNWVEHVTLQAEDYYTHYTNANFGGLIGRALYANNVFRNTVNHLTTTNLLQSGTGEVGGLIGSIEQSAWLVDNTVKNSSIISSAYVGGLIGTTQSTSIERAKVVNTIIEGGYAVGGLIGQSNGQIILSDSFTDTSIKGSTMVGGLIGGSISSQVFIDRCFTLGTLEGNQDLGGFIGLANSQNYINNAYSRMTIRYDNAPVPVQLNGVAESVVGGIIGYDLGDPASTYTKLYFAGTFVPLTGVSPYVDPIIGYTSAALPASIDPSIVIGSLYYDSTLYSGPLSTGLGMGLTTAQLMELLSYNGFDFVDVWKIDPRVNDGYAYLDEGFVMVLFINEPDSFGYTDLVGNKVIEPTDPTKTGFIFGGWFTDEAFTEMWDFDEGLLEDDLVLYAKWTEELPDTGEATHTGLWLGTLAVGLWFFSRKRKST